MRARIRRWCATLFGLLILVGCASPAEPTATPETPPSPSPTDEVALPGTFIHGPCAFALPDGVEQGRDVTCGYLFVPERHGDTEPNLIRLAVAIFATDGQPAQGMPVVYLSGGPGASALETLKYEMPQVFQAVLNAGHDLVVFDQRGVGRSRPALDCPEANELSVELADREVDGRPIGQEEAVDAMIEAFVACGQRLGQSVDLSAYNSAESAQDVADLIEALGFDQVTLWGGSYGTRLALEVMRQMEASENSDWLHSVVLDAVYPPDVDLYAETPANFERALERLFESCAANSVCDGNYPDLRTAFLESVAALNAEPHTSPLTDLRTGEELSSVVDGDLVTGMVFQLLYSTDVKLLLPELIYDVRAGDFAMLQNFRSGLLAQQSIASRGMMFSVQCSEEVPFGSPDALRDVELRYPEISGTFAHGLLGELTYRVCERWDAGRAAPSADQPVTSDVPTLIMTGEFDPVTPPAWGRHVAETLTRAYAFEYPGVGHGASAVKGCPQEMFLAFLADPSVSPDDTCISEMHRW